MSSTCNDIIYNDNDNLYSHKKIDTLQIIAKNKQ